MRRRWRFRRPHRHCCSHHCCCAGTPTIVDILLTQGDIPMSTPLDITTADHAPIEAVLGAEHDAAGNEVTTDPIVSGAWSVDNPAVLAPPADLTQPTANFTPTGTPGTATISYTGTTQSGATVTGSAVVNVTQAPPVQVDVVLTQQTPAA